MPEGIPYSSSNVIAGTGLDLNYIGNHCFAYSGSLSVSSSSSADNTALNFTTGNRTIKGRIQLAWADNTSSNAYAQVKINGIIVIENKWDDAGSAAFVVDPYILILPPYTSVEVLLGSANSSSVDVGALFTGKVYK